MRIKTLNQLWNAVKNKKAVTCPNTNCTRVPAAVLINMSGTIIKRLIDKGLFIDKKRSIDLPKIQKVINAKKRIRKSKEEKEK
jgi:hypothetical protein